MVEIKKIKPRRSYTGEQWRTNQSNKKRLVKDFNRRCAYCDDYHLYSGGYNSYHVEHFAPKEHFPSLEYTYDNLLYSCPYCNISKSDKWPSEDHSVNITGDIGFLDPCNDDYYDHLKRRDTGEIIYQTNLGEYIYFELKLYLKRHCLIYNLDRIREKQTDLKKEIEKRESVGKNVDKLKSVYEELCVLFCEYFDLFALDSEQ
ncbi:HNH endonuclease [Lachnoclostridium sp.]|uniref:HNH endonuclease n=1 Tax=Lachnoclostridium sp. TaxID=2028282 RepID=UPI002898EE26|nr:HNH endonuclease [Lachnoclostridium sp.]